MAERNLSIRLSVVDGGKVRPSCPRSARRGSARSEKSRPAATPASGGLKLLSSAANDAKFQLQAATDRLGMLGSVLGNLGPAGLLAGASIAALGVGITALVMPVARVGDEFFKLSQKTGVSVQALTALDYAAKLSDVSTEGMTKALQKLSVAMFDTQVNGVRRQCCSEGLGRIRPPMCNGQIRPTEPVLLDLADETRSAMPDGADKAALGGQTLRQGRPVHHPVSEPGTRRHHSLPMEEAQRLGLVMSEDGRWGVRGLRMTTSRACRPSSRACSAKIGAAVIPVLADFTEQVILAQGETGSFTQRATAHHFQPGGHAYVSGVGGLGSGLHCRIGRAGQAGHCPAF